LRRQREREREGKNGRGESEKVKKSGRDEERDGERLRLIGGKRRGKRVGER